MEHSPCWPVQAGDEACFVKDRRNEVVPRDIIVLSKTLRTIFILYGGCL